MTHPYTTYAHDPSGARCRYDMHGHLCGREQYDSVHTHELKNAAEERVKQLVTEINVMNTKMSEMGRELSSHRQKRAESQFISAHVFVSDGEIATDLCRVCSRGRANPLHLTQLQAPATDVRYRDIIQHVSRDDVSRLLAKDREYGASWKRRGGVGAYMMMIRKIDRVMAIIPEPDGHPKHGFDVFAMLVDESVGGSEQLLDTMRDLRGYLTLIEAEHRVRQEDHNARRCHECGRYPCSCGTMGDSQPTTHHMAGGLPKCDCGRQQWPHTRTADCSAHEEILREDLKTDSRRDDNFEPKVVIDPRPEHHNFLASPHVNTVCSVCDLDVALHRRSEVATHGAEPTADEEIPF